MSKNVVTALFNESLQSAFDKMKRARIRHLPVIDNLAVVVGMLSERDLERAMSADPLYIQNRVSEVHFDSDAVVEDFMTRHVRTINEKASLKEAAVVMHSEQISSLVVIDDRAVMVGILTSDDLLKVLIGLLSGKPTVLDEFKSIAYTSPIGVITDFLNQAGI
jgi:CBS domain-containing protein